MKFRQEYVSVNWKALLKTEILVVIYYINVAAVRVNNYLFNKQISSV